MEHPLRTFRARQKPALSLDALALLSGTAKASLSRIETGLQQPNFETIRKLIEISANDARPLTADDFINFPQQKNIQAAE